MKRVALIVGGAAALAALVAASIAVAASTRGAGGCTLHILGSARTNAAEQAGWQKVFADFKQQYGCTVTAHWQGQFTDVPQELNEAHLAHQTVDVVTTATTVSDEAKGGNLLDLTKLVKPFQGRFPAGDLARFTIGGHVWAIPLANDSSSVFFYNATLFKQLHLKPPTTYAQFVRAAKTIKAKTKVEPLIEGGKDTWEWPMWYFATFAQTSHNDSIAQTEAFLDGKRQFTAPDSVAALADIAQFAKDGLLGQDALDTDENGAVAAFLQGKAAMFYDGTWILPSLRAGKPRFQIGVLKFPLVAQGAISQSSGAPEGGLAIPSFAPPQDVKPALQFLEFVTRKQEATRVLAPLNVLVPSVKSVPSSNDPLAVTLRKDFLPTTIGWLDWIWPNDVNNAVIQAIEGVLYNHQSPQDAAKGVQNALNTLKQQQGYSFSWFKKWSAADWAKVEPTSIPKIQVKR